MTSGKFVTKAGARDQSPGQLAPGPVARLDALTSLRFVAAMAVVLYHTAPRPHLASANPSIARLLIDLGYIGVGIFFVLSGFILSFVYGAIANRETAVRFLIARIARIYPAYLLSLLADVPRLLIWRIQKYGEITGIGLTFASLGLQAVILPTIHPSLIGLNPPTWSIGVEVVWYIAYPLIAAILLRVERLRTALFWITVFWIASISIPAGLESVFGPLSGTSESIVKYNPLTRLPEFLIGILLFRVFRPGGLTRESQSISHLPPILLAMGAFLIVAVAIHQDRIPYLIIHNGLLIPAYAMIIWALACCSGRLKKALECPSLVQLGESSYSIYLLHMPMIFWFEAASDTAAIEMSLLWYFGFLLTLVGVSFFVMKWIERPGREWIIRKGRLILEQSRRSAHEA